MSNLAKLIALVILGLFLYSLILNQSLDLYTDGRLGLLVLGGGLGLILSGLSLARRPDGHRYHWVFLWLLWLPAIAGFFYAPTAGRENASVLYLARDASGYQQLYKIVPGQFTPQQLTSAPASVLDYAPAPNGQSIAYALSDEEIGQSDIWVVDSQGQLTYQLLDCGGDVCRHPTWSPDSRRLLFERGLNMGPGQLAFNARLFWLDVSTGTSTAVFSDPTIIGSQPRLSPNGQWLSYLVPDPNQPLIQLYNLNTNSGRQIQSQTGENGVFHPVVNSFFFTGITLQGESIATHIFEDNLNAPPGTTYNRSGEEALVDDSSLAWSPSGSRLAFTRKPARTAGGKQLWLMAPDGAEQTQLTSDLTLHHGPPKWAPNGRVLLFQRFDTTKPEQPPSIWTLNLGTGVERQIAPAGIQPQWLP
jgi:Tol biopolymer transport system component